MADTLVETLFDPPHLATADEAKRLWPSWTVEELAAYEQSLAGDDRLMDIWAVYQLRGDVVGMRTTEARFQDQSIVAMELRYRDVRVGGYD